MEMEALKGQPTSWRLLRSAEQSAAKHMAEDERLAREAFPTVRFFTWSPPTVSLGRSQAPPPWLSTAKRHSGDVELIARPSGGGMAFHGSDLSIAVVVPRFFALSLASLMRTICRSAAELCRSYGADALAPFDEEGNPGVRIEYCLAQLSAYAVTIKGRKVAGFALRRYPQSWLVQGSLLIRPLPACLTELLPQAARERLNRSAISLSEALRQPVSETGAGAQWMGAWSAWWEELLVEELAALN